MDLSQREFERIADEALESLPPHFIKLMENVVIVVEEEPNEGDLAALSDPRSELLGIYRGVPRPLRTHDMLPLLPDQIAIFRGPILRTSRNAQAAQRQIRETVLHELGHYFGLSDGEMIY
ncbi:MAG TPA: metallopeptidase family protein [Thermoanaerobaculia bacterium]|nr:metallopeptidase family protein [Thermoanaerobaculia bacterium]